MIDTSYRDVIAEEIDVFTYIDKETYDKKNNEKSWQYCRYPKIDANFICISKDGTLGKIFKVGDLLIGLPNSKGKKIYNGNEKDRNKCVWKRTAIPKPFLELEANYKRDMRKARVSQRKDIRNNYVEQRNDLINNKYKAFVRQEFNKRKNGIFIKIDQEVCYLTGENYMFLNYYYLAEDKMYPNFRITAMHTWWHWEAVCADSSCWGELRLKSRRVAWTCESASIALNKFTITKFAEIPVVSENDRLAKKLFAKKIVNPFSFYPSYFKPLIDDPNDKEKTNLEIVFETDNQETSEISTYPTKAVSYDSTKATYSINDEVGKYKNVTFTEFRGNHKDCHFKGSTVVSKARFGSTAGEFTNGGESFQYEYASGNAAKRDKLGKTSNGLISLFVDDCYTLAGYFDFWGYPIVHDPEEPILNENHVYVNNGSITYWTLEYENKKKKKKSDLNNFLRQHPRTEQHAFRDVSGAYNDFDMNNLNDHEEFLTTMSEIYINEKIFRGNLVYAGDKHDSPVIWRPNANGKIVTTWIPDAEMQNMYTIKNLYGKKLKYPMNNDIGCFGVDSYDIDRTVDDDGSNGACIGYTKFNMSGAPSNSFFLKYEDRPDKTDMFYEQVTAILQFYGMYALIESNKPRLLYYMKENGMRGYSMTRPDKKLKDLKDFEKDYGGIYSSSQVNADCALILKNYISDFIGGDDLQYECRCYFIDLIRGFKRFNLKKRKEFDKEVAAQLALLGSQYKVKKRKGLHIRKSTTEEVSSTSVFGLNYFGFTR